ncbi:chemotaxis protein CheC [candidate division WOR-3 bacterium]|nr:chemotaxis protein CheC [candidate division WOR-3 bacterium]
MRIQDLKELQLDGIKESANIGSGHAATALSQMLGKKVSVEVPKIEIIPIEKTPELLGRDAGIIVASLTKFFGDVTGRTLIVMSDDNAKTLVKILLNKEMSRDVVIDDMGISSLKEVANILCSSYLNAISEFLGLLLLPSVPVIIRDDFGAIISSVYLEFSGDEEFVFCVKTIFHFKDPEKELEAYLLLIPDTGGLTIILKAMDLL